MANIASTRAPVYQDGLRGDKRADEELERFRFIVEGSDAEHVKYPDADSETVCGRPLGVTTDGADAAEDPAEFRLLGVGKDTAIVKLNGTCSEGDFLTPEAPGTDATGKARTLPTDPGAYWITGRALEDGTDEQEVAFEPCTPYLAGGLGDNGPQVPAFAGDPDAAVECQMWYDLTNNRFRVVTAAGAATLTLIQD